MPYISLIKMDCDHAIHGKDFMMCCAVNSNVPISFSVWNNPNEQLGEYSIEPQELIKLLQIYCQGKSKSEKIA